MNQQQPMPPQMGGAQPKVRPWLWIVLIVVVLTGAGFFGWYFLMGPGKKVETSTTTPSSTTSNGNNTTSTTAATTKTLTYTDKTSGISFSYPKEWATIQSIALPEGTGVSPVTINFAIKTDTENVSMLNDLSIEIAWKGEASNQGFEDLYNLDVTKEIGDKKATSIKIGDKDGQEYSDLGGLASNPTLIALKEANTYFVVVRDEKSTQKNANITETQLNEILASFKFTQ